MTRRTIFSVLSIFLAVVVPLMMAWNAHTQRANAPVVRFKIEAYDPRDLLYGQYMTYRFDWNWKEGEPAETVCQGPNCCLCVSEGAVDPEVSVIECKEPQTPQCTHTIKGTLYGQTFDPGFSRYYVDETIALPLEKLFMGGQETFRIGLGLSTSGKAILERLYINDQPLEEYLSTHGGEIPVPEELPQP